MKKRLTRSICVLLCVLLLTTGFVPAASALNSGDEQRIVYEELPEKQLSPKGLELKTFIDAYGGNTLLSYLAEQAALCPDGIDVSQFNIPTSLVSKLMNVVWYSVPEAFHIFGAMSYQKNDTIISKIFPQSDYTQEEYAARFGACVAAADKLLYGIENNSNLDEVSKAVLIHDRLAEYCEYDYANYLAGTLPDEVYDMSGALADRKAVCQGYAMAYMYLLRRAGIEAYYCSSDTLNHGWNLVYINNVPYHVDCTWDDPVYDMLGRVIHENILLSTTDFIAEPSGHDATDFDATPVDGSYLNMFWTESETGMQIIGDTCYYFAETSSQAVLKSTPVSTFTDNSDDTDILTVNDKWEAGANGHYGGNFSALCTDGRNLFYSTKTAIYKYNVETGTSTLFYSPDLTGAEYCNLYGFSYDGKELKTDLSTSPSFRSAEYYQRVTVQYLDPETCGANLHDEIITVPEVAATCTTAGSTLGKECRVCGEVLSVSTTIAALNHSYALQSTTPATCTEKGVKTFACTRVGCTDSYTEDIEVLGHIIDNGVITTPATCTTNGIKTFTCTREGCDYSYPEDIEKLGHTYNNGVITTPATCTTNGIKTFTCTRVGCTDSYTEDIELLGHIIDNGVITTPATCTTNGIKTFTCTRVGCGDSYTEELSIIAHSPYESKAAVNATCTQNGSTKEEKCSVCGKVLTASVVINATGHKSVISKQAVAPTCTKNGNTQETKCSVCGTILTASSVIVATGHNYKTTEKAPTCTQSGGVIHTCTICNDSYTDPVYDALGHVFDGNGICTRCKYNSNPQSDCSCICHKTGFMGFIYKIVAFFWRIFDKNPVCECGARHY